MFDPTSFESPLPSGCSNWDRKDVPVLEERSTIASGDMFSAGKACAARGKAMESVRRKKVLVRVAIEAMLTTLWVRRGIFNQ